MTIPEGDKPPMSQNPQIEAKGLIERRKSLDPKGTPKLSRQWMDDAVAYLSQEAATPSEEPAATSEAYWLRKNAVLVRELGSSMSPGALAAAMERRADALVASPAVAPVAVSVKRGSTFDQKIEQITKSSIQSSLGEIGKEFDRRYTPGDEVAWLIERKDYADTKQPHWYAENADDGWHWWTNVATEAKRFATKADAEAFPAFQMIASDPTVSITEHVFLSSIIPATKGGEDELRRAWEYGRNSWCPAGILTDKERTEREWREASASLSAQDTDAQVQS